MERKYYLGFDHIKQRRTITIYAKEADLPFNVNLTLHRLSVDSIYLPRNMLYPQSPKRIVFEFYDADEEKLNTAIHTLNESGFELKKGS